MTLWTFWIKNQVLGQTRLLESKLTFQIKLKTWIKIDFLHQSCLNQDFGSKLSIFNICIKLNLPEMIDFLIQKFEQSWREKLEILNNWLFWRSWSFVSFGFRSSSSQGFSEISVNRIIGFSFTFWRCDPIHTWNKQDWKFQSTARDKIIKI